MFDMKTKALRPLGQLVVWKGKIESDIFNKEIPYGLAKLLSERFVVIRALSEHTFQCNGQFISTSKPGWISDFQETVQDVSLKYPFPLNIIPKSEAISSEYKLRETYKRSKPATPFLYNFQSPVAFRYVENGHPVDVEQGDNVQISSHAGVITKVP